MAVYYLNHSSELYHHGIMGMHWGVRRFQPYPKGYKGDGKFVGSVKRVVSKASNTKIHMPGNPKDISMKDAKSKRLNTFGSEIVDKVLVDKYGDRGATRIARHVMNGATIDKAIKKEKTRRIVSAVLTTAASMTLSHFVISPVMQLAARAFVSDHGSMLVSKALKTSFGQMGLDNVPSAVSKAAVASSLSAISKVAVALTPNAKRGMDVIRTVDSLLPGENMADYYPIDLNST